jgi:predicted aspartyl protease
MSHRCVAGFVPGVLLFLAGSSLVCGQEPVRTLDELYSAHAWFALRSALEHHDASSLQRGAVAVAFNRVQDAERAFREVLSGGTNSPQAIEAREWLTYLYQRAGRYKDALGQVDALLAAAPGRHDLENARALFGALAALPAQQRSGAASATLRYSLKDGNLFIPATVNGRAGRYMVDTGAAFSTVSASEARRLGLRRLPEASVVGGDSAGHTVGMRLATSDRFAVGGVVLHHVVFAVVEDDAPPFDELPAGERGVIGLPVLLALSRITWTAEGSFVVIRQGACASGGSDLAFDGNEPVIDVGYEGRHITAFLDTGATKSRLSALFAAEFPSVLRGAAGETTRVTGLGGAAQIAAATVPDLALRIGEFGAALNSAEVLLRPHSAEPERRHGTIGLDLLLKARCVAIDFEAMRIVLQ